MTRVRIALIVFAALLVALGAGYAMGGSGRYTLQSALDDTRARLDL